MTLGRIAPTLVGSDTCQHFTDPHMLTNQNVAGRLASTREQPEGRLSPSRISTERGQLVQRREQFRRVMMLHAGCLLLSVPNLTPDERQFLYDIRREEARTCMTGIPYRLVELTARSTNRTHREQLGKMLASEGNGATMDLYAADVSETRAQGEFDIAVKKFRQFPSAINREEALRIGREQIAATEEVMQSIAAFKVA